jgi:hypothetical protein
VLTHAPSTLYGPFALIKSAVIDDGRSANEDNRWENHATLKPKRKQANLIHQAKSFDCFAGAKANHAVHETHGTACEPKFNVSDGLISR